MSEPMTIYQCPECGGHDVVPFTCGCTVQSSMDQRTTMVPVRVWPDELVQPLVEAARNALGGRGSQRLLAALEPFRAALEPFREETTSDGP